MSQPPCPGPLAAYNYTQCLALWAPGNGGPGGKRKSLERDPGIFPAGPLPPEGLREKTPAEDPNAQASAETLPTPRFSTWPHQRAHPLPTILQLLPKALRTKYKLFPVAAKYLRGPWSASSLTNPLPHSTGRLQQLPHHHSHTYYTIACL